MCQSLNIVYLSHFAMKLFIPTLNKACNIQSFLCYLTALFMCQVFEEASNCKRNTDRYYDKHVFILLTKFNFVKRLRYKEIARQQECVDNVILIRMRYGHLPVLRASQVQSVSIFSNRY